MRTVLSLAVVVLILPASGKQSHAIEPVHLDRMFAVQLALDDLEPVDGEKSLRSTQARGG